MQKDQDSGICNMELKRQLFKHCKKILENRIQLAREDFKDAREAAEEETKSSAGDKYETGRAMMLMEMDKHGQYLTESTKLLQALDQLGIGETSSEIIHGCLVLTNYGLYYLAISLGSFQLEGNTIYTISPVSPIGEKMMGLKKSDTFDLNGRKFVIEEIC